MAGLGRRRRWLWWSGLSRALPGGEGRGRVLRWWRFIKSWWVAVGASSGIEPQSSPCSPPSAKPPPQAAGRRRKLSPPSLFHRITISPSHRIQSLSVPPLAQAPPRPLLQTSLEPTRASAATTRLFLPSRARDPHPSIWIRRMERAGGLWTGRVAQAEE